VSDDLPHLNPAAAELLQAPHDQRIRAILGERWVQYARAGQVLRILNLLLEHPRTTRMPSIAIYGDSGMGKTMIMHRFRAEHPQSAARAADRLVLAGFFSAPALC
jgi:predicted ATPase